MTKRWAEIYKQEKKDGGGLLSSAVKTIGEKIDPRQIFDRSGIIATLFPFLKSYSATKNIKQKPSDISTPSPSSLESNSISALTTTSMMTAKNTMILPAMARDMNLMRLNIAKLVKLQGGTASTKADMFFRRAGERESLFESAFSKMRGKTGAGSGSVKKQSGSRDGQTKDNALFVETVGFGDGFFGALFGKSKTPDGKPGKISGFLKKSLPYLASATLPVLGLTGLAGLLYFLVKKDSGEQKTIQEMQDSGGYTPEQPGVAAPPQPPASDEELKTARENMRKSDDPVVRKAAEELDRQDAIKAMPDQSEAESRRLGMSKLIPLSPEPQSSVEQIPSNVVRDSSGQPVRSGTGGFVTSGETDETTTPSKVESATIPTVSGIPIDYKSYAQKIGEKESGGDYKAVNTLGYLGKYQFGAMALQDMGLVKKGTSLKGLDISSNWNIEGGKQAFLNNPQLQEDTMLRYTKQNFRTLNRIGVVNKDSSPQEIAGYLAASHLLGPGGAKELSKGNVGTDAYGTSSASYFKVGSATQSVTSNPSMASATPTSGSTVSSATASVSDSQRELMTPTSAGSTVIDNSNKTTVVSNEKRGKSESAYDTDLIKVLINAA